MTNLRILALFDNQISDITPIENLTNLQVLDLKNNKISDVTPLAGLANLRTLYLKGNPLGDTSSLANLKLSQTDFEITDDTMADVVSISDTALADAIRTELGLNPGDPITTDDMLTLTKLDAQAEGISDLTGLEHATNLTELTLNGNQISDVTPLAGLTSLQELDLQNNNQISDVAPLAALTNLTDLILNGNQISDLTPLSGLTNLTDLSLDDNQIIDVTPLAALTNLESLGLGINQISDVSPLAALTNLESLFLINNQISDVTPLAALTNLRSLYLKGNPLGDTSSLANLKLSQTDFEITEPKPLADVNNDDTVNILDLVLIGNNFGETGSPVTDVNGDGVVNIGDLVLAARALAEEVENQGAAPILHASVLDMLTAAEVKVWLAQAQHLDTTDPVSQKGIRFLEQLLAALTPKDTVLLPNYPNPFNPETWIPYQLAVATDVQITIYDAMGRVVRRLDLGHQSAGYYTEQSRAAYWDGRNGVGESVASGIYFYQLQADNMSHLRKMLILK